MSLHATLSDVELVDLLVAGDGGAFTEIYQRYHAALYIHVFNKLRNREESRDIVQELFSSLWNNRQQISLKSGLAGYLYAAARYKVFDHISKKEVASRYLSSFNEVIEQNKIITDYLVREKEFITIIDKEIAALPPKMREIFELSRKESLSHREIAERLGLSEKTVKKQVNNSLKILRQRLGDALFTIYFL